MIMTGDLAGKRVEVPDCGLRFGRASSNDLHIPDEELSRNHCLFEPEGDSALRVIDLASANGTYVNSVQLGADAYTLKVGDIIEAGKTAIKIVDKDTPAVIEPPPHADTPTLLIAHDDSSPGAPSPLPSHSSSVDLGLEGMRGADIISGSAEASNGHLPRAALANILWGIVAVSVVSAIALVLLFPAPKETRPASQPAGEAKAKEIVKEVRYEKIEADADRIFRYEMSVASDGTLRVVYDDVPGENRHIDKSAKLQERALKRIEEIFSSDEWLNMEDGPYTGASASDENALKSYRIRTIGDSRVRDVLVENSVEPAAFQRVREALEALSQNELGIWALHYSRDKLLALATDAEKLGDAKWDERDVEHGNVSSAAASYNEAIFYLETVNPKPAGYQQLKDKHARTVMELDRRYRDQRFLVDKSIGLSDWKTAADDLATLLEIIPDANDERHTEAEAKLLDVERRLKTHKRKGVRK